MKEIRTAAIVAALAIGAAACGGTPTRGFAVSTTTTVAAPSQGGGSAPPQQSALIEFASCMRAHGVTNFPDPSGGFLSPPPGMDPNSPVFQNANHVCQSLLPNQGSQSVTSPQNLAGLAKFASCMGKHGIPMSAEGNGSISFGDNVDPNSQQFQVAKQACIGLVPDGLP